MPEPIKRIGVFTSGGDAPGMNACVRAVVRTADAYGISVTGILRGYEGMIEGELLDLNVRSVSNILQKGGTILKTARSAGFRTVEGRAIAAANIKGHGIEALIGIGGDGTLRGATELSKEHGIHVICCPGTIDNDLYGTDCTIGFDTAINTAIDNIDKIRDTADAHNRLFLVEVMGRDAGFIALHSGIGGGAELVLIPETIQTMEEVKQSIHETMTSQLRSSIVIVAEGDELGGAMQIGDALRQDERFKGMELRVCILGHTQRGGSPSASDRVLASRLGMAAVDALVQGHGNVMVGVVNNQITLTPSEDVWNHKKTINFDLLKLAELIR
jgi:6-phosphofructokinase 1